MLVNGNEEILFPKLLHHITLLLACLIIMPNNISVLKLTLVIREHFTSQLYLNPGHTCARAQIHQALPIF
jgi:hypothetical protein